MASVLNSARPRAAAHREADRARAAHRRGLLPAGPSPSGQGPAPSWKRRRAWGCRAVGAEPDPDVYAATVARVRRAVQSPIPLRPPPVIIPTTCWICSARRRRSSVTSPKCRGQLLADTLERAIDAERRWAPEGWEEPTTWAKCLGSCGGMTTRGQRDLPLFSRHDIPLWSEPFAAAAAVALQVIGGRRCEPPVSWMGGKRRLALSSFSASALPRAAELAASSSTTPARGAGSGLPS